MPISREPQVSDLGVCDRETANLGLAQQSPRGARPRTGPGSDHRVLTEFLSHGSRCSANTSAIEPLDLRSSSAPSAVAVLCIQWCA